MTKILLVEDDAPLSELIASYLHRFDYEVIVIHRGDQALERASVLRPDLVILDLTQSGLDGLHVRRQLRDKLPALPIIMLAARDKNEDQILGLETGADHYVANPAIPECCWHEFVRY